MFIIARCYGNGDDAYYSTIEADDCDHKLIVTSLLTNLEQQVGGPIDHSEVEFFRCEKVKLEIIYRLHGV